MNGSFSSAWEHLSSELWEPLATYANKDAIAPPDLFSDLFSTADEYVSPRAGDVELAEARSDPTIARSRFLALTSIDFPSESAIVLFLEEVHDLVGDYEILGFVEHYSTLVHSALTKFNLRYRLEEPFSLRFLLPGSFVNLYSELVRIGASNQYLAELFDDFEKAFNRYARSGDSTDMKFCLSTASNYLEGLAVVTCGHPGTLGKLASEMNDWPHASIKEGLARLYGFCSDYPGIRHAGNPASKLRDLSPRDLTLVSLLLVSYSGYLSPMVNETTILGT